ncbi:MAG: tetratricopeptide repeat protein [Ignavibacteria bacterium]
MISLVIVSSSIYYMGCASAESTTGKLAFQQQDFQKAEIELKKGLAVDQNDDEGWYMLGYSQIELGKFEDAQRSFKKSLTVSNNFNDAIRRYWVEKFNTGAKEFQAGIDAENKKDKENSKLYYQNALKSFQASTAIFPDSLKSFSAMGETYLALGQNDKALEILNNIASKSNSKEAAERVARILFESGLGMMQTNNYTSATETFKKVLSLNSLPKDNAYYETSAYNVALGLAKLGENMRAKDDQSDYKGKFSEALVYLEPLSMSLTKKDLEPLVWDLLVSVYANLGMTDKAQDALKKKESLKN